MLEDIINIAENAGKILMKYHKGNYDVSLKSDKKGDVVTTADYESDKFIRKELSERFDFDILSEENDDTGVDYSKKVWIADPLDGTHIFTIGEKDFSVMIGLADAGLATLGVMHFPAKNQTFYAKAGEGAYLKGEKTTRQIFTSSRENPNLILRGRAPYESEDYWYDFKEKINPASVYDPGGRCFSQAAADILLREADLDFTSLEMKWDVCAPDAIIHEASGRLTDSYGNRLDYRTPGTAFDQYMLTSNGAGHDSTLEKFNAQK